MPAPAVIPAFSVYEIAAVVKTFVACRTGLNISHEVSCANRKLLERSERI